DLGDERLGWELPPRGHPRVELAADKARLASVAECDRAAGMQSRRARRITARVLYVEEIRDASDVSLEIVHIPRTFAHEPRLAVTHRLRLPRQQDGRGPPLIGKIRPPRQIRRADLEDRDTPAVAQVALRSVEQGRPKRRPRD